MSGWLGGVRVQIAALALAGLGLIGAATPGAFAEEALRFTLTEPGYEASATVDPAIAADAEIFDLVKSRARAILPAGRGYGERRAARFDVEWTLVSATSTTLSLLRSAYVYSGGAHGETSYAAEVWNRAEDGLINVETLFAPERLEVAIAAINAAAADDLESQKTARGVTDQAADRLRSSEAMLQFPSLSPSTVEGVAGGLTFWSGSYGLGAYAEGAYTLTVPQSVFRDFLAEPYRDWFGGEPAPAEGRYGAMMCGSPALVGCEQTE